MGMSVVDVKAQVRLIFTDSYTFQSFIADIADTLNQHRNYRIFHYR